MKIVGIYKKYFLKFQSTQGSSFFLLFYFAMYRMVDSEHSMIIYKSVKNSIGTVMKNPEMLKFVPNQLKTKKMCNLCDKATLENGGTLKPVSDCYKNQQMCGEAVDNYSHVLEFVPECYKTQKMCDKAVDIYPSTIEFVPHQFKTQEMGDKAVDKCPFVFDFFPDWCKTREICDKVVFENRFKLKYCHDRHKTQEICNKVVDDFLPVLKFVPHLFPTGKMIKKFITALYAGDSILHFNEYSGNAIFTYNGMGILSMDLNNIKLDDTNYDGDDPETIIHVRLSF